MLYAFTGWDIQSTDHAWLRRCPTILNESGKFEPID